MKFLPEEFDEILNIFRDETDEIIQKINNNLLHLEENPENEQIIMNLFQNAHSLKGAARMVGFYNIQNIAHKIEDILSLIKDKKLCLCKSGFNTLYKSTDFLLFLIGNSVQAKEDFYCDSIESYNQELDYIIKGEEKQPEDNSEQNFLFETEDQKLEFINQSSNINALLLEAVLVLKKYNDQDKGTYVSILFENFANLLEIFKSTKFQDITEKIEELKNAFEKKLHSFDNLSSIDIDTFKEFIISIIDNINEIFNSLNISKIDFQVVMNENENHSETPEKNQFEQTQEINEEYTNKTENELALQKEVLDYLSQNISQIKFDPSYIENSQKCILSILENQLTADISKIYKKIFDILEQIKKLNTKPENDIITILTQSINITKKIILDKQNEEGEDLSLLFQRLSIVEQMIDISESKNTKFIPETAEKKSIEPEFQKVQDFFKTFEIGTIKTLRVDTLKLDSLISQTGELIINGIKTKKHLSELQKLNIKLDEWNSLFKKTLNYIKYYEKKSGFKSDLGENTSNFTKQLFNLLQGNQLGVNELISNVDGLYKKIHEDDIKLNHIILEIENIVKNIRVLPLATVFHMLPRMIRDIAANSGKEVEVLISGSETTVDKKIIEEIKMPLIHILRNSIDHGIERPEDRLKTNKPRVGTIHLSARYDENKIIIEVQDDGLGINIKKIKEKALQKGLLTQDEVNSMSDEQITNLIFYPGFSTGDKITEISGRGIGLDIVQTKISQLNGKVKIYSSINQGAKVIIELPISMSTIKCFIVDLANNKFAVPMSSVRNVQWIDSDKIFIKDGYHSIIIDKQTIPIIDPAKVLGLKPLNKKSKKVTIVVLESDNIKAAYIVDQLLGDQEVLHKKLSPPIYKLRNISGITTLASGDVCLIINPTELLKNTMNKLDQITAQSTSLIEQKFKKKDNNKSQIMIVDDSRTTLSLLERILLNEGYIVKAYSNPISALEKLKYDSFDLIISDVEMPSLNGREFVRQVKNDEMLSTIPIIIVSTLEIKKIKEEFKDFNIGAYIHKPDFNRNDFLKTITDILETAIEN